MNARGRKSALIGVTFRGRKEDASGVTVLKKWQWARRVDVTVAGAWARECVCLAGRGRPLRAMAGFDGGEGAFEAWVVEYCVSGWRIIRSTTVIKWRVSAYMECLAVLLVQV